MTRKICAVVTARPSYSRVQTALRAIDGHPDLRLDLVVSASALLHRYGNTLEYIEQDGFRIAERVYMVLEGENLITSAKSTGLALLELATVFDRLSPDAVITIADRFETLATAIAASYMNIPLVHVQGGEVTGSIDEKVRHAVTKLADLHLVSTAVAKDRVIKLGEAPGAVHVTGCPSIDLAAEALSHPKIDFDILGRYGGVGPNIPVRHGEYVVVLQHPVTTEYEEAFDHATETLHAIADSGRPTLWFWPNVDAGSDGTSKAIRVFREAHHPANIHFFRNMRPMDFLRVIAQSACMVGNSSAAIREASFLGVPAVNIGTRQAGRERGPNVLDAGYDRGAIADALDTQVRSRPVERSELYGDGQAGPRIAEILASCELGIAKKLTI